LGVSGQSEIATAVEASVGDYLVDRGIRACDGIEPQRP